MSKTNKTSNNESKPSGAFDFNEVFQNNIKIYNNLINASMEGFNTTADKTEDNKDKKNLFKIEDLLKSINPTTNKIFESIEKFTAEIGKNPQIYHDNIGKWITQITSLNFYFVSKLSNQSAVPPIQEEKTDKRFFTKLDKKLN